MRKNHFAGDKFSRRHTTSIDAAEPVIKKLNDCEAVQKIRLGKIVQRKNGRSGQARVKILPVNGGHRLTVACTRTAQEIYVYTPLSEEDMKKLLDEWVPKKKPRKKS